MDREAEALSNKLQDAAQSMMEDIDNNYLRKMQKNTYLKMASCQDISSTSGRAECAEKATIPLQKAQHIIQNEMNQFQNRLKHCAQACENEIHDKFDLYDEKNRDKIEKHHLNCAKQCVEKNLAYLKSVKIQLEKNLSQL